MKKILNIRGDGIYVTLIRLTEKGLIKNLSYGIYQVTGQEISLERIGCEIYYPSYVSSESALFKYGILSQSPYSVFLVTKKASKKLRINNEDVIYRRIKPDLFWGYQTVDGYNIAEPEKALLDQIYYQSKGISSLDFGELSLINLDRNKLIEYSKYYPKSVKEKLGEIIKSIGINRVSV